MKQLADMNITAIEYMSHDASCHPTTKSITTEVSFHRKVGPDLLHPSVALAKPKGYSLLYSLGVPK
jgi:hypothetical protein